MEAQIVSEPLGLTTMEQVERVNAAFKAFPGMQFTPNAIEVLPAGGLTPTELSLLKIKRGNKPFLAVFKERSANEAVLI